ncbi:unnamed protein product [Effrenium voratum]|uniref:RING-type domain-containing protein n=1 Tax=Effrenium voratum TaxID=2562239 RepID=A0AA36JPT8_9DINO|nr:unnamed protein product [Effrenium voratum]CAJ1423063.1 unnamed protein product [Effrenium voratum]
MAGESTNVPAKRKMSDLSESTAEDLDFCEYVVDTQPLQMRCPICLEVRHGTAGDFDHNQRWIVLQCCEDAVCRQCLRQHLQINGNSCPLNASHRLVDMDVIAGCCEPKEWVKLEQRRRYQEAGGRGFCCTGDCASVMPACPPLPPWNSQPFPAPCPGCQLAHCGRCGSPWPDSLLERHLCEDLRHSALRDVQSRVAAERLVAPMLDTLSHALVTGTSWNWVSATVQTLAAETARARLNGVGLSQEGTDLLMDSFPAPVAVDAQGASELRLLQMLQEYRAERRQGQEGEDVDWLTAMQHEGERIAFLRRGRRHTATLRQLETLNTQRRQDGVGPIKDCPSCQHPTERIDGCNIMTCSVCKAEWCFICARCKGGPSGCNHYHCQFAEEEANRAQGEASSSTVPVSTQA